MDKCIVLFVLLLVPCSTMSQDYDWACDFKTDTCGLSINEESWAIGQFLSFYFIEAIKDTARFTIPHDYTSGEGILSFEHWQIYSGSLTVTVCKSQNPYVYGITYPRVVYEDIIYSCNGIDDVKITFAAKKNTEHTLIRVLDVQLQETSIPSTGNTDTTSAQIHTSTNPSESTSSQGTSPTTSSKASPTTPPTTLLVTPSKKPITTQPTTSKESTDSSLTMLGTGAEASTVIPVGTTSNPAEGIQGGRNSAVTSAVCSVVVLIVIIMVIIAIFIYMRRRSRDPKVTEPVDQGDDDPNLYNNPVYCSKDDGLRIPDLIISTNSNTGSLPQARHPSTFMDTRYEEFEGNSHPVTNADDAETHHDALSVTASESNTLNSTPYYSLEDPSNQDGSNKALDEGDYRTYEQAQGPQPSKKPGKINEGQTGNDDVYQELNNTSLSIDPYSSLASPKSGLPKKDVQNGGKEGQSDGPAVLDDEGEYNALNFNKSSDITRALKKPMSGGEGVNNGYGVLDLPEQKDSKPFVNSLQLHNADVYNTLEECPQEQQNGKQQAPDQSSGYQALKLGQSNIPISHQGLNHKVGSTDDGSTGGYQSLSPGTKGPGPKAGSYERDQPDDESEYHGYQDPSQMNQDGSARTPTELDVFSSDNYNILNSGKEVGDYHGYQDPSQMNQNGSARTPTELDVFSSDKYNVLNSGKEVGDYHGYQDPSQMNQDGSARTPTELDDFSSDKYNILNSGKEVGDYHVYQATDDTGVDEGNYEDLDTKMSREDEYSEIDQCQNHTSGTADKAPFEPIYSDEIYSEFQ